MKTAPKMVNTDEPEATNATGTIHIDTSIQIERCKARRKAKIVEEQLKDYSFTSTSSYAKFEFKCAWLKDLGYLYAVSLEVNRVEELVGRVCLADLDLSR